MYDNEDLESDVSIEDRYEPLSLEKILETTDGTEAFTSVVGNSGKFGLVLEIAKPKSTHEMGDFMIKLNSVLDFWNIMRRSVYDNTGHWL